MAFKFNMSTVKAFAKTTGKFIEKNAPAIAAGIAITGMVTAVISAIKAGPEVSKALEEAELKKNEQALKERMEDGNDETPIVELTWKEKGFIYAKYYWKTVLFVLLSATAMVGSVHFGNKKIRALTILAATAEGNLAELEKATRAVIGDKKFEQIKGKLIDQDVETNPPKEGFIANTANGDTLCYEPIFGTYYWSNIPAVDKAYSDYYDLYLHSGSVYMEDLYHLLGISKDFTPELAGDLGHMYDLEEGYEHKPEYTPRSVPVTLNGTKYICYVMGLTKPKTYDDLMAESMAKASFRKFK